MADSAAPIISAGREFDEFIAHLTIKGLIASIVVAIVAVVVVIQDGLLIRSIVLLVGSAASLVGLIGYVAGVGRTVDAGTARRGLVPMLLAFSGLAPYAFGCYLVFYEGLWNLWGLFGDFTWGPMWAALFYLVAGYVIVLAIYRATEFGRALNEGRVVVKKAET